MVYIRNRFWSSGSNGIPLELVTGKVPNLSNLRVFVCPAYVHIDVSLRSKFGDTAWKGVFVGYAFDSPAWLVYNPSTRKGLGFRVQGLGFRSRNVVFNEEWLKTPSTHPKYSQEDEDEEEDEDEGSVLP